MNVTTEGAIAFAVGLLVTAALLAGWLPLARRMGWTVRDRYKPDALEVMGRGGLVVIAGWPITLALIILFQRFSYGDTIFSWGPSSREILLVFTALACAAIVGLVDDLRKLSQPIKALLPLLLALPLAFYLSDWPELWPAYALDWPVFFVLVAALLYVSLGTNLTNMHAGFNGLAPGNALIMLLAVALVAESHSWPCVHISGWPSAGAPPYCELDSRPLLLALAGATAALLLFNRYPARVMEGNVGSHLWGGAIAAALLIEGVWLEGLVLFAPQLVDFGLWGYARLRRYPFQKYAPLIDGEIRPDDLFKLKFLVARRFPREWQAVPVLWGMQLVAAVAFVALAGGL